VTTHSRLPGLTTLPIAISLSSACPGASKVDLDLGGDDLGNPRAVSSARHSPQALSPIENVRPAMRTLCCCSVPGRIGASIRNQAPWTHIAQFLRRGSLHHGLCAKPVAACGRFLAESMGLFHVDIPPRDCDSVAWGIAVGCGPVSMAQARGPIML